MTDLYLHGRSLISALGSDLQEAAGAVQRGVPAPRRRELPGGTQWPWFGIGHVAGSWGQRAQALLHDAVAQAGIGPLQRKLPLYVATSSLHIGAIEAGEDDLGLDYRSFAEEVAGWLSWSGPVILVSTACTSSMQALMAAAAHIRAGEKTSLETFPHDIATIVAMELAQLAPDVILTVGTNATAAVRRATSTIPIVVATAGDLVQNRIVQSFVRPGGNITGTTIYSVELGQKRLQILKEAFAGVTRVAVLGNARSVLTSLLWEDLHPAGRKLGLDLRLALLEGAQELDSTFAAFAQEGMEALVVLSDSVFNSNRDWIVKLAAEHRLPAMYEAREFVQSGGLMSYGPDIAHMSYLAAGYVDKVLKGAKPGDLPIEQPSKFQFVVNLRAARELGVEIPVVVLYRADEVIE